MSDTFRVFSVIRGKTFRELTTKHTKNTKVIGQFLSRFENSKLKKHPRYILQPVRQQ